MGIRILMHISGVFLLVSLSDVNDLDHSATFYRGIHIIHIYTLYTWLITIVLISCVSMVLTSRYVCKSHIVYFIFIFAEKIISVGMVGKVT